MKKQLGSSPYNAGVHSLGSQSSSDTDLNKSTHFSDAAEAYTELKVKGNFTPAPIINQPNQSHPSKSTPPHVPTALKELVQLMQGYVDTIGYDDACTVEPLYCRHPWDS